MLERGNGSSKAGEIPPVNSQCPTLEQWNHIQSVETISEVDPEIVSHVENCQRCLARLEQMTSASRRVFDNLLNVVDTATTEKFPITVPKGYELAGEPIFGGRGIVIKLKEIGSNRHAALKVPNQRWKTTAFERKKLIAESEAISLLDHPGIVKLISVVMSEDQPAILMEWVEGSNLRECLTVREPNIDETLQLIISLTDAVSHAHERGILHRDIKPSNIIVCGKEFKQIKLCDFGLAKMKAGRPGWSSGTELIGTPGYMAPETIRNEIGKVGPAVDVFSIGVVMYRLLNGKMPFDGINPISLGIQVLYHEPQSIRSIRYEVPEQLEAICLKCLSKEPDERYPDAIALRADLDRFVKGKPVHATRSNYFHRIKRWARREPRLAALTGLFVCFMAITIAILGILLDKSRASEEKAIQNANQARMNGEIASRNANEAERRLVESVKAMSLASPVFKRILNEYRLNPDEIKKITEFAKLRENLDAEAIDLKERLNHHFLTLELADCLRRIKGEERNAIELAALARQKIGKLISEDGKAASKAEYGSIPSENFRISVLEKALLRYGQACSQLQASYPRPIAFGL